MPSLYSRVLGAAFNDLPPIVRSLHSVDRETIWSGRADVQRGTNPICRIIAAITRLPPTGLDQAISVTFTPNRDGAETWTRQFGDQRFVSVQSAANPLIREQIGPVTLHLRPTATTEQLSLTLERVTLFGIVLPRLLHPTITTREAAQAGRYTFDVEAHLPVFGLLVRYHGWLTRNEA